MAGEYEDDRAGRHAGRHALHANRHMASLPQVEGDGEDDASAVPSHDGHGRHASIEGLPEVVRVPKNVPEVVGGDPDTPEPGPREDKDADLLPEKGLGALGWEVASDASREDAEATSEKVPTTSPMSALLPVMHGQGARGRMAAQKSRSGATFSVDTSRRKLPRRRILIMAGCVAGGLAALVALCVIVYHIGAARQAAIARGNQVATMEAVSEDFTKQAYGEATVGALWTSNVTPEVSGTVSEVKYQVGDYVEEGELVLVLSNDALDTAVRDAENKVDEAQEAVDTAQTDLDNTNRSLDEARKQQESAATTTSNTATNNSASTTTTTEGSNASTVTSTQITELENQAATEQTNLDNANKELDNRKEELTKAQEKADRRNVYAPASGSVVAVNAQVGTGYVVPQEATEEDVEQQNGAPLMVIGDLSQFRVTARIPETSINEVDPGQSAFLVASGLSGTKVDASVDSVSDMSYGEVNGQAVFDVDLIVENPPQGLSYGMTGTVTITTDTISDATVIPSSAIYQSEDGSSYVNVVVTYEEGGTQHIRPTYISVLSSHDGRAAVEGVDVGDKVEIPSSDTEESSAVVSSTST